MKKKIFTLILVTSLGVIGITGCKNEEPVYLEPVQAEQVRGESSEKSLEEQISSTEERDTVNDEYMTSIQKQSDIIKNSLEQEILTQQDINLKSQQLFELWDNALNELWGELKGHLPKEEFSSLLEKQRAWITEKEKAVEEAGKEVEGGSMYAMVVNMEAAKITEERVYELYELLK